MPQRPRQNPRQIAPDLAVIWEAAPDLDPTAMDRAFSILEGAALPGGARVDNGIDKSRGQGTLPLGEALNH